MAAPAPPTDPTCPTRRPRSAAVQAPAPSDSGAPGGAARSRRRFRWNPNPHPRRGGFDGVVYIENGGERGSGTLLSTGRDILTAAHVVDANFDRIVDGP